MFKGTFLDEAFSPENSKVLTFVSRVKVSSSPFSMVPSLHLIENDNLFLRPFSVSIQ